MSEQSKPCALLIGAHSDIALATARAFAEAGYDLQLAARNVDRLESAKTDLELRHEGVSVSLHELDILQTSAHKAFIENLPHLPDIAICAVGLMGEQTESEQNIDAMQTVFRTNYEAPAALLSLLANQFETRGSGTIVGISSVAGERGRASNYIYGSAKAGFTAFLSGLRNRLAKKGVHIVTVLPGFVDTAMTAGMDLPKPLLADPDEVARAIKRATAKKRNIIYVRPIWRLIMLIITHLPEFIFKRTQL